MWEENFQQNLLYMVSTIFSCHILEIYSFWVLLLSVLSIFLVCVCVCVCVYTYMFFSFLFLTFYVPLWEHIISKY